jgi:hypothetical protein
VVQLVFEHLSSGLDTDPHFLFQLAGQRFAWRFA